MQKIVLGILILFFGSQFVQAVELTNAAPGVSITGPADGASVAEGTSINFLATANDAEDGDLGASLNWNSSIDGDFATGSNVNATLSVGVHTIIASVTDSGGLPGSGQITVTVTVAVNVAPGVSIIGPADGASVVEGTSINFLATANDAEDGDLGASLNWNSSIDGDFATGSNVNATLSVGVHTIIASVTDSGGLPGSGQITVTVTANGAPGVSITGPADGASVVEGTSINFLATANDAEDGDLGASLNWNSSIDGDFATGSNVNATLSVGVHTIIASVTDSGGLPGSGQITVTVTVAVNVAPGVSITGPADGASVVEGTSINFLATANDAEDGDLGASLNWNSSIDGDFATGSNVNATLSVGVHTIIASVTDSGGLPGSGQITVTVTANGAPGVSITGPADGASVVEGTSINFLATANDAEDGDLGASLNWNSSIDGDFATGSNVNATLSVGVHTIIASVTDSGGLPGSGQITVTVTANGAPGVSITGPADGASVVEGTSINFLATANDAEDGDLGASLNWNSSIDGDFATGSNVNATLSVGVHTIIASVTDSGGLPGSGQITVTVTVAVNVAPGVSIIGPADGASVVEGTSINFLATANDAEDGDLGASLNWNSSIDGDFATGSNVNATLSVGVHTIIASVTDSGGLPGSGQITVTVTANGAPGVSITGPADGASVVEGTSINFLATANDAEDGDLGASLNWNSSIDGDFATGSNVNATLSVGVHTIIASVTDSGGLPGSGQITVTVTANGAPGVSITGPADGASVVEGTSINFLATANDAEDGDLGASLNWNSSIDGDFATGSNVNATLSVGVHTIIASVTDSGGLPGSGQITVTVTVAVNVAPGVSITGPADGASVVEGTSINFLATANDAEDGDLGASLNWNSSIDGDFATGSNVNATLSVGVHTIIASVTDSGGLQGSQQITVTVAANIAPSVSIIGPADGTSVVDGASITFIATATDDEDGDLGLELNWSSNLDGDIGAGGTLNTTLSIGIHTITASVTDSGGLPGSAQITVTVTAEDARWLEVYPGSGNVKVGETLEIHISGTVGEARIEATRRAAGYNSTVLATAAPVLEYPVTSAQPWRTGADWPVGFSYEIPADWEPGFYDIRVRDASDTANYQRFIVAVQPEGYGEHSQVAVLLNGATANAYENWGGKNNYKSFIPNTDRAHVLAFNRPGVYKYEFVDWQLPRWLDLEGIEVEYVTTLELHYEAGMLDAYNVLVLSGHSEYWSREMRAELERFLDRGGKLISLSGNTMWWSVRFEETPLGVQMISCKNFDVDPLCQNDNPDLFTGSWSNMGEPETRVLGASYRYGGYVDSNGFYPASEGYGGYFAERAKHWFWAGSGVLSGDHVGQAAGIAGYEADAPPIVYLQGKPIVDPTAADLPDGIEILATTPAATSNWEGNGAIIYFTYGDNGGEVFNCGSVDCSEGLLTDPVWRKAMLNVFARFDVVDEVLTDYDFDGIDDLNDNCIDTSNPEQLDSFSDGTGDACDVHCH